MEKAHLQDLLRLEEEVIQGGSAKQAGVGYNMLEILE
jgi:ribosome-associated protein YbcJ (S4-like RNA binding protein)